LQNTTREKLICDQMADEIQMRLFCLRMYYLTSCFPGCCIAYLSCVRVPRGVLGHVDRFASRSTPRRIVGLRWSYCDDDVDDDEVGVGTGQTSGSSAAHHSRASLKNLSFVTRRRQTTSEMPSLPTTAVPPSSRALVETMAAISVWPGPGSPSVVHARTYIDMCGSCDVWMYW
jgi:hypothetical protein